MKPDFFRHERLQELESEHPRIMLFFSGLWCQSDKMGRFRWKPKTLKLDILPFVEYNPSTALEVLMGAGFITKYEVDGEEYGEIVNFKKHQLIWGSELKAAEKFPGQAEAVPELYARQSDDNGVRSQELGDIESPTVKAFPSTPDEETFEDFRKKYPGERRGGAVEWANFVKKFGKRRREILPLLLPALKLFCRHHAELRTEKQFIPHLSKWINNELWTKEYPSSGFDARAKLPANADFSTMTEAEQRQWRAQNVV